MAHSVLIFLASLVAFAFYKLKDVGQRPKGYPPGPPTLPLIGNLHLMPSKNVHVQFQKWAEEYGPVFSLILGTQVMVVLNTDHAVKDLLDKRSNIYSSRPEAYLGRVASSNLRMLLMPYGESWRLCRKLYHNLMHINAAKSYIPYQDLESKAMMASILDDPARVDDHIRRYTTSIATQIMFGFRTPSIKDHALHEVFDVIEGFGAISGAQSGALLDVFPLLRSLPTSLQPLYNHAIELQKRTTKFYVGLWTEAKQRIQEGTGKPSLSIGMARAQEIEGFSDAFAGFVSGSGLEAASDTTASQLRSFVEAMLLFPEAQAKAQEAIDRLCGDRYPTMEDMDHPGPDAQYIRACVKENLRWLPVAPMGFPHAVIRDDEYMGFTIPKGAAVVYNAWAIHNDPTRHPSPRTFDPSRYLHDTTTSLESAQQPDPSRRDHFGFGAGRRVCQGMHVAERSLFLAIARLVWAFTLTKAVDPLTGRDVTPDPDDLPPGFLIAPVPFPVTITPRTEGRAATVRRAWADCLPLLDGRRDSQQQWREIPEGMPFTTYEDYVSGKEVEGQSGGDGSS